MRSPFLERVRRELRDIEDLSLAKVERQTNSSQGAEVSLTSNGGSRSMLNLCANNHLGLADNPAVLRTAVEAGGKYGFGMAAVRFICGTLAIHRKLEHAIDWNTVIFNMLTVKGIYGREIFET